MVQWLRLPALNAEGGPGDSIPGRGTRSYMPQQRSKSLCAATKTRSSQIHFLKKKKLGCKIWEGKDLSPLFTRGPVLNEEQEFPRHLANDPSFECHVQFSSWGHKESNTTEQLSTYIVDRNLFPTVLEAESLKLGYQQGCIRALLQRFRLLVSSDGGRGQTSS